MKANVYLLRRNGEWSAWMTLSPEVDHAYWFGSGSAWGKAEFAWFWQDELPLGQAAEAVERWKERASRMGGVTLVGRGLAALWDRDGSGGQQGLVQGVGSSGGSSVEGVKAGRSGGSTGEGVGAGRIGSKGRLLSEAEAVGLMSRVMDEIKAADIGKGRRRLFGWGSSLLAERYQGERYGGSKKNANGKTGGEWIGGREQLASGEVGASMQLGGYVSGGVDGRGDGGGERLTSVSGQVGASMEERRQERVVSAQAGAGKGRRRSVVRWSAGDGRRGMDADRWSHVAAIAKLAAGLLQGRALLSGEARDLLAGAAVPGAEANWSEAIQLAALLGQVRLSGAVAAPVGKRADARRRLRCLRCGSGEAQLRRAACLACGRECAYCEACILMGRSRECELLIRGIYDSPVWKEKGLGRWKALRQRPMKDRLGKWGLSPAQRDATAKALHYLEEYPVVSKERTKGASWKKLNNRFGSTLSRFVPPNRTSGQHNQGHEQARSDNGRVQEKREQEPEGDRAGMPPSPPTPAPRRTYPDRQFLIWAVTGAGKTEMVFPLVESVVSRGGCALIASPRRDVVLELDPRIRRAFPALRVVTLYGGSDQRWEKGEITLSTTHQLLRFHEAFDLVIIDELDAFPYHGDPMLHYAADKCRLPGTPKLLLSATPPRELQREARRGKLAHARVPVRYHRHPLPVPKLLRAPSVRQLLATGRVPLSLMNALKRSLGRGAQIFLFVQRISESEPMAALLRKQLRASAIEATSSQDSERAEKVIRFRNAVTRVLVTTTILERGVTVPRSDVFILDADGKLFDEASLVQMAGRAGRSSDDPAGKVYFVGPSRTLPQLQAVRHIRGMNRIATKRGYLLPTRRDGNREEPEI